MELKIDPYTLQLVKENRPYIVSLVIFLILLALIIPLQAKDYFGYQDKIDKLNKEITELERKKTIIYSFAPDEADQLIETLNILLPVSEDYFSISTALQRLSNQTGFKIVSYAINFQEKRKDKVAIVIEGEGTPDALLNFLENYQYKGGRLITMNEISFSPSTSKTSLTLNFYAKDVKIKTRQTTPKIDKEMVDLVTKISQAITSGGDFGREGETIGEYEMTTNPFQF